MVHIHYGKYSSLLELDILALAVKFSTIIYYCMQMAFVMVALWNRADHYFHPVVCSSSFKMQV